MAKRGDPNRLSDEIEELFAELWRVPRYARLRRGFRPEVDCYRTDDPPSLTVVVELAGVDPADVYIDATARSLVIHGTRRRSEPPGRVYQQMEIEYGPFHVRVPLAADVDTRAARASYERGLLTILLPLAERPAEPVKVPIRVRAS